MRCEICLKDKGNVKKIKANNVYTDSNKVADMYICNDCLKGLGGR